MSSYIAVKQFLFYKVIRSMSRKNSLRLTLPGNLNLPSLNAPQTLLPYYLTHPPSERLGKQLSVYQLQANRIAIDLQHELDTLRRERKHIGRHRTQGKSKRKHEDQKQQKDNGSVEKYQAKIAHYESLLEKLFKFIEDNINSKAKEEKQSAKNEDKDKVIKLELEVQKLTKENQDLRKEYFHLQREAEKNRNTFGESLQTLHNQNHELYSQLEQAQLQIKKCYDRLNKAQEQNTQMCREMEQFQEIYRQAVNRTDYQSKQNQELRQQLQRADHQLNKYVELLAQMRNSFLQEKQSLKTATSMISGLQGIYQQKISKSRHVPEQFEQTISRLKQASQCIEKELSQKGALIERVELKYLKKGDQYSWR